MEATTALVMFALLAFLVERLTNGIALILEYTAFWRRHFEADDGNDRARNQRNYRNRRIFLFVLGIAVAVPLCILFELNIFAQLQLLPVGSVEFQQAATGLLAATGADPIREIVLRSSAGESRYNFGRDGGSGGPSTIQVEARLVASPGTVIRIDEAAPALAGPSDSSPERTEAASEGRPAAAKAVEGRA
jgi:hypothetical protein